VSDETQASSASDAQVAVARPNNSQGCLDQAARVLTFAEMETHPERFDQYTTLADKWMELGALMGGVE
jgi:hypothetical protein